MEFHKTSRIWGLLLLCLVIFASTAYSDTITVGPGGAGAGYDYGTIQDGIDAAVNGDTVIIAPGVYTGTGNKNLDFGGRAITVCSTDPNDPCVVDATIIDCQDNGRGFYFHNGEDNSSIISGLTIVDGKIEATSDADDYGGGILCLGSSPRIENCCILSNAVRGFWYELDLTMRNGYGGGIACIQDSHPKITNCRIKNNSVVNADFWGYIDIGDVPHSRGGGLYCDSQSSVEIIDSEISGNVSRSGHGHSDASFVNWPYYSYGGGIYAGNATITNCLIAYNKTRMGVGEDYEGLIIGQSMGAGIYCGGGTTISNCTIYGNDTDYTNTGYLGEGGGIYCSSATVMNSIIWANEANEQIYGSPTVTYSDVQDGFTGTGNINSDPCFVSGPGGDFYLSQIAAGQASNSPCINAGSDTAANLGLDDIYSTRTDHIGDTGIVDMGFHYSPIYYSPDINGDYFVNFIDIAILANQWMQTPTIPSADIVPRFGFVNTDDLDLMVAKWLNCFVGKASEPDPSYNVFTSGDKILSWTPGEGAISHDVYFSTDINDVNDGAPDAYMGNVIVNQCDPCGLEPNTTYYWRIDEVRPACTKKGDIWSFTTLISGGMVSHWKFDEGEGSTAYDSVFTNHGSITGATWTTGQIDGALSFDGDGDYVDVGDKASLELQTFTLNFWAKHNNPQGYKKGGIAKGKVFGDYWDFSYTFYFSDSLAVAGVSNTYNEAFFISTSLTDTDWHMWTLRAVNNVIYLYKDGQLKHSKSYTGTIDYMKNYNNFCIGANMDGAYSFDGVIDDVRFYYSALSNEDIEQLYLESFSKAYDPYPEDGAVLVDPNVVLSWTPGYGIHTHDVYLGTDFNDVNNATHDSNEYQDRFDVNSWDPCGLEHGKTYYWRIDEVNSLDIAKGDIWNFTTSESTTLNLVSWWKFDEGEGEIAYDSIGTNHGSITGATWTTGLINGALSFDGFGYIGVGDKSSLELQSFTLTFWAQHDNPSGSLQGGIAKGKYYGSSDDFAYKIDFHNSTVRAFVSNTSDTAFAVTAPLTDTDWHMWTMTAASGILSIYKDGAFVNSTSYSGAIDYNKNYNSFSISSDMPGWYPFDAIIDDIRVYSVALPEEIIWQLYQDGLNP